MSTVNNSFYSLINALVKQGTGKENLAVTDLASFVDAGQAITALGAEDLQNGYLSALINRIGLVVDTSRSYRGAYGELRRGQIEYGNTIELIMQRFYDAQPAEFGAALVNGQAVDQFKVHKPDVKATYFVKSNTFQIPITVEKTESKKMWTSPAQMQAFIDGTILYVVNSKEYKREMARIGMVSEAIAKIAAKDNKLTVTTKGGFHYDLLAAYKAEVDATFAGTTVAECLNDEGFVKFAVATMKKVLKKMERPSASYNISGETTFTGAGQRDIFISSDLEGAIDTRIKTNNYHPEASMLPDYISVPYWQAESAPFSVKSSTGNVDGVIGFVADRFALGEYTRLEEMDQSPYNAAGRYWNYFLNVEDSYCINEDANMVLFTIG